MTGSISAGKELRKDKNRVNRAGERLHAKRKGGVEKIYMGSESHVVVEPDHLSNLSLIVNQSQPYKIAREFLADLAALQAAGVLAPERRSTLLQVLRETDQAFAEAAFGRLEALRRGIRERRLIAEAEWAVFIRGEGLRAGKVLDILARRSKPVLGPVSELVFTRSRG